jgi:hypothetical protein
MKKDAQGEFRGQKPGLIDTTVGRAILWMIVPKGSAVLHRQPGAG